MRVSRGVRSFKGTAALGGGRGTDAIGVGLAMIGGEPCFVLREDLARAV
jgi:hypothetical protein